MSETEAQPIQNTEQPAEEEKKTPEYSPKETLYVNNLNEKVKLEGKTIKSKINGL